MRSYQISKVEHAFAARTDHELTFCRPLQQQRRDDCLRRARAIETLEILENQR
jgi:hypothetical protein